MQQLVTAGPAAHGDRNVIAGVEHYLVDVDHALRPSSLVSSCSTSGCALPSKELPSHAHGTHQVHGRDQLAQGRASAISGVLFIRVAQGCDAVAMYFGEGQTLTHLTKENERTTTGHQGPLMQHLDISRSTGSPPLALQMLTRRTTWSESLAGGTFNC